MKKMRAFILTFLIVLFIAHGPLMSATGDLKVQVTSNLANIRTAPSLDTPVIGKVTRGQVLDVLERIGNWYRVTLPPDAAGNRITGFINENDVGAIEREQPMRKEQPAANKIQVIVSLASIRTAPSLDTPVIGKVTHGQMLEVHESLGDWYRVTLPPDASGKRITGFIQKKDVDSIEFEKPILKEMKPGAFKKPARERVKIANPFGLIIKGGLSRLSVGDINTDLVSYGQNIADLLAMSSSGSVGPIHFGPSFSGEFQLALRERFGIAIGVGYMNTQKESRISFDVQSFTLNVTGYPRVKAVPIHFNLVFEPVRNVFLKGGGGYYFVRCDFRHRLSVNEYWVETGGTAKGRGFGYQGGIALVVPFSTRMSIVIEGMGRHAQFNNFSGKNTSSSNSGESSSKTGDLYYYETTRQGKTYGSVLIAEEEPSIGSGIRRAEVDLSGFSISVGLKLKI